MVKIKEIRKFGTDASRDTDEGKIQYARHLSPEVIKFFCEYMHKHRKLPDGSIREPDNWKKGFPKQSYVDSGFRHFIEMWSLHEKRNTKDLTKKESEELKEALCGIMFNAIGHLHEELKDKF